MDPSPDSGRVLHRLIWELAISFARILDLTER
jgi:hypothetical protein